MLYSRVGFVPRAPDWEMAGSVCELSVYGAAGHLQCILFGQVQQFLPGLRICLASPRGLPPNAVPHGAGHLGGDRCPLRSMGPGQRADRLCRCSIHRGLCQVSRATLAWRPASLEGHPAFLLRDRAPSPGFRCHPTWRWTPTSELWLSSSGSAAASDSSSGEAPSTKASASAANYSTAPIL